MSCCKRYMYVSDSSSCRYSLLGHRIVVNYFHFCLCLVIKLSCVIACILLIYSSLGLPGRKESRPARSIETLLPSFIMCCTSSVDGFVYLCYFFCFLCFQTCQFQHYNTSVYFRLCYYLSLLSLLLCVILLLLYKCKYLSITSLSYTFLENLCIFLLLSSMLPCFRMSQNLRSILHYSCE